MIREEIAKKFVLYIMMILMMVLFIFPFFWMLSVGMRSGKQIFVYPPQLLPNPVHLDNFTKALKVFPLFIYLKNTIYICSIGGLGLTIASSMAAYTFARLKWWGSNVFFIATLSTVMLPFAIYMVPYYILFGKLGMLGTLLPLWLPFCFGNGFSIFLCTQFFKGIPLDLSDAAKIDGCSEFGIYARIILPLSRNILFTVFILHFVMMWKNLLVPLVFLSNREMYTVAIGLQMLQGGSNPTPWEIQMSCAAMACIPSIFILFLFFKTFTKGVVFSGLKG